MERPSVNIMWNREIGAKHQILAVSSFGIYRMYRENRFWTTYNNPVKWYWEPTLIQLHR